MTRLEKTTSVLRRITILDKAPEPPRSETFAAHDLDTGEPTRFLTLLRKDWEDLGKPDAVTVSVVPGDDLRG